MRSRDRAEFLDRIFWTGVSGPTRPGLLDVLGENDSPPRWPSTPATGPSAYLLEEAQHLLVDLRARRNADASPIRFISYASHIWNTTLMVKTLISKAVVLHEALPYIRAFHGARFVVKYGGNAMVDPELRNSFARDITLMKYVGLHPIVVHGGGPQIDEVMVQMGARSERVEGLRITDDKTMGIVEMVLGGKVNQEICTLIGRHGGRAVGLSGVDDAFLQAERVAEMTTRSGQKVDPGRVGAVREVRTEVLTQLVDGGFIPVIAPIAVDAEGRTLNVNADTVAGAIAAALQAKKLVLMTDIEGIQDERGQVVSSMGPARIEQLIGDGVIQGGMIPKVRCGLEALRDGVKKVHIIDGRMRHACLLEIFTDEGIGTQITSAD